ncbi:homeodomain-interacting protein kinase 1-like isoform X1 [Scophthalmus maximus]|uniref:Protein kinase domain-containing protein n=1 Tax=Scophthalmus maximus TaxID=52904 RepID=A0A8D3ECG4_SCOMX|nr:homeodomain-interacting protein kinase 1-like isoform X1 [Scophthalmus maximus]
MFSMLPAQNDQLVTGDCLKSGSSIYHVQSILGKGSFSMVAKCTRMDDMKIVAIKMMKNEDAYVMQAKAEVDALTRLRSLDPDKCNLVRWHQVFTDRGHICLEFEHLDKSVFDFMKERCYQPLHLIEIRPIAQQLANALNHLKAAGMIHADLKLENVMFVNHRQEPFRVKVIDFGLARTVSTARSGSYIQTCHYRSPEILLGLPFTEAIDMWSLGCMIAAMYLGTMLYPGMSEYEMIRYIVETQGQPPDNMLTLGSKTCCFFQRKDTYSSTLWKLKSPEQFHKETGIQPMENRMYKFASLDNFLNLRVINRRNYQDKIAETRDVEMFVDMLKGMLKLDASKRITPRQVLQHRFTSMHHIINMYHHSHYVVSCCKVMDICQKKAPLAHSGKTVCGSQQQPPFRTANPVQSHCINSSACTSTTTPGSDRQGMKTNVVNVDGNINPTASALRTHPDSTHPHKVHVLQSVTRPRVRSCHGCKYTR